MKLHAAPFTLAAVLLMPLFAPPGALAEEWQATTVVVVRHAEKTTASDDPGLTTVGEERSNRLRDMTLDAGVTALFSSRYRRTQATVQPLADALGLDVTPYDAKDSATLAAKILAEHRGGVVVVAGHSNTVPGIVAALGAPEPHPIDESQYDNLFVVIVPPNGDFATAVHLKF